jgi:hypothetical protein
MGMNFARKRCPELAHVLVCLRVRRETQKCRLGARAERAKALLLRASEVIE